MFISNAFGPFFGSGTSSRVWLVNSPAHQFPRRAALVGFHQKGSVLVGTSRVLDFCSKLSGKYEISRYATSMFFRIGTGRTHLDPLLRKTGNFIEIRAVNAAVGFLTYCRTMKNHDEEHNDIVTRSTATAQKA